MMAPRDLVSGSIFTISEPTLEQTVHELQTELHNVRETLKIERFKRARAEANAARLRVTRPRFIPSGDMREGYDCGNCGRTIYDDYTYCPDCGAEIDWCHWRHEPNEDDFYREATVTRPLSELFTGRSEEDGV